MWKWSERAGRYLAHAELVERVRNGGGEPRTRGHGGEVGEGVLGPEKVDGAGSDGHD